MTARPGHEDMVAARTGGVTEEDTLACSDLDHRGTREICRPERQRVIRNSRATGSQRQTPTTTKKYEQSPHGCTSF